MIPPPSTVRAPRFGGAPADLTVSRPGDGSLTDGAAFEDLFRTHYARLHAFVWRRIGSRSGAEELVQELFLRVWREAREGIMTHVTREYLYRGAHFLALDFLKRQRLEERWHVSMDGDATAGPAAVPAFDVAAAFADAAWDTEARALADAATAAVARMPARRRQIYLLCRQDGLSYTEIAHVLGISVNTVKVQMGRAMRALRVSLAPFLALVPLLAGLRR